MWIFFVSHGMTVYNVTASYDIAVGLRETGFSQMGTSLTNYYLNGMYQYGRYQRVDLIRDSRIMIAPKYGIYRCEIAVNSDKPSVTQSLYVGIYSNDTGEIMISGDITVTVDSDLNGASPEFTLTCISTGGPATTVTWTRDSTTVTEGKMTELVNTRTAQYTHTLSVTGRMPGLYNCTVENNKPSNDSRKLSINVASAPNKLRAVIGNDSTSINLTWTPPTPLGDTTGYRISFTGGGNSSSVDVSGGNYTLTGLTRGEMYNISIVGISKHFFSQSVAWNTVTLPEREEMDRKEQEERKSNSRQGGNTGSIAAGVLVPLILVAVNATLVVVTLIWLNR
ncbi:hypothetical protein GBAR_LOCUS20225 [Geodia barretti]|nr:hypothetical protein GBAR_LOCUS20225 [Geodia barretti]